MVVARCQIDRREPPVFEGGGRSAVTAEERFERVRAALGLEYVPAVHRAHRGHGPIGRRDDGASSTLDGPRARSESTNEERVEVGIGLKDRVLDNAQVNVVPANEPAELPVLPWREANAGRAQHQPRQQVLRIELLARPGEAGRAAGGGRALPRLRDGVAVHSIRNG